MNEETKKDYLQSLEKKAFQEAIFSNLTTANFLEEVNKKKNTTSTSTSTTSSSDSSPSASTEEINKKIEEINAYFGQDDIKLNDADVSVGTVIKREAMKKLLHYDKLTPEDIAFVDCGLNCIVDMTRGTLTNQKFLFSKKEWEQLKVLFPPARPSADSCHKKAKPVLKKVSNVFNNSHDTDDCYWVAKHYQRKASKCIEKIGYELISVILDKMIKYPTIFSLSKPTPSEADVMIKIWADLFEVLFHNTGIYIRWGEKGLDAGDDEKTIFKLDANLVLLYDDEEYPVSAIEFAPYAGPKKITTDRSKLLVEAKTIYDKIVDLNANDDDATLLSVVNLQIMSLEAHEISIKNEAKELYVGHTIESFMLPSTVPEMKKRVTDIIGFLFGFKNYIMNTTDIIKTTLNDKKKIKKSMKRKLKEYVEDPEAKPTSPMKRRIVPTWRYSPKSKK